VKRLCILLALALCAGSCSISREIRVVQRGGQLAIDFPWSLWRLVGLQDRVYPCVYMIELFDSERLLWALDSVQPRGGCVDAAMPIIIGEPRQGFLATGTARLRPGRYGVSVQSWADGRVDFVLRADGSVENITKWNEHMLPPCGTRHGGRCPPGAEMKADPGSSPG